MAVSSGGCNVSRISEGDLYWRSARAEEFDLRAPGYRLAVGLATGQIDRRIAPYGFSQPTQTTLESEGDSQSEAALEGDPARSA